MSSERLADYVRLLEKASAKFDAIRARRPSDFACGRGCSACCAPDLTVFPVEIENIKEHLAKNPEAAARARAVEKQNPHRGRRCMFLDEAGSCTIYEARPLICRTHGAPLVFRQDETMMIDACPLNFKGGLEDVEASDTINLDLLNSLLALVNQRFEQGEGAAERHPLRPSSALADDESPSG